MGIKKRIQEKDYPIISGEDWADLDFFLPFPFFPTGRLHTDLSFVAYPSRNCPSYLSLFVANFDAALTWYASNRTKLFHLK